MSTFFLRCATFSLLAAGCAHAPPAPIAAAPAAPDSAADADGREWSRITVTGSYGTFDMRVPLVSIRSAPGTSSVLLVDSVALRHVERRLTARIARVARAEAAALRDTTPPLMPPRSPAPPIQPGLLGAVTFENESAELTAAARERITAMARLAAQLDGPIEVSAHAEGTGAALLDAALLRARVVYLALLRAVPALAQREVALAVRTHAAVPGAPRQPPAVEVFAAGAR